MGKRSRDWSIQERLISSAAVGALRTTLMTQNMGLSESQCILVDEMASEQIRTAVVAALRRHGYGTQAPQPNADEGDGK